MWALDRDHIPGFNWATMQSISAGGDAFNNSQNGEYVI